MTAIELLRTGSGGGDTSPPTTREWIFRLVHRYRRTSQTDLVRMTGLGKATVSEVIAELMEAGLVRQVGKLPSQGRGRNRVLVEIDPLGRFVYGAQFDGERVAVVLTDLYAEPQASASISVGPRIEPEGLVAAVAEGIDQLDVDRRKVLGLGVGVPGSLDPFARVIRSWMPGGWQDVPIHVLLEQAVDFPVRIANRGKVAALGELWHGAGQGSGHLVYVYLGSGLGAGIVIGGQLYGGAGGAAGELAHLTVVESGPRCRCGNRGCLHVYASQGALSERYTKLSGSASRTSRPPPPPATRSPRACFTAPRDTSASPSRTSSTWSIPRWC